MAVYNYPTVQGVGFPGPHQPVENIVPFGNASHLPHPFRDLPNAPQQRAYESDSSTSEPEFHTRQAARTGTPQYNIPPQRMESNGHGPQPGIGYANIQELFETLNQPLNMPPTEHTRIQPQGMFHGAHNAAPTNAPVLAGRVMQVGDIVERRFTPPSSVTERVVTFKLYGVYIGDMKVMYCLSKDDLLVNTMPWLYPQVQQMCEFARVEIDHFFDWRDAQPMTPNLDQWTRRSGPGIIKERIAKMRKTVRMQRLPLDRSSITINNTDDMSEEQRQEAEAAFCESYALWDSRKFACWVRYGTPFPYPYPYNSAEELQKNLRLLANFLEELRTTNCQNVPDADSLVEPEIGQLESDAEALLDQHNQS